MEKRTKFDKRKVMLLMPIVLLAFSAVMFWFLGGGTSAAAKENILVARGINTALPDANFKRPDPGDKLGYYEQTDRDSAGKRSLSVRSVVGSFGFKPGDEEVQTRQINDRLEALNREISRPEPVRSGPGIIPGMGFTPGVSIKETPGTAKSDVDRLEQLMKVMQSPKEADEEVTQLNGMLDKILSIQNPELMKAPVVGGGAAGVSSDLDSSFSATPALIMGRQKARPGSTIRLVIQDSMRIGNMLIPKGHELFGACRITNQRLLLDIKQVRLGTSIIPVNLSVYSLDGMPGIDAPDVELGVAAGAGTNDVLQSMQFLGMDQSLGVQAAGAGIDAAKQFLGRKVRKVRVKLQADLRVLLRNNRLKGR